MNQGLVQINDNYGVVSDESGNIKLISKENNDCEFQDILKKENELEYLNASLKKLKEELATNASNTKYGEVASGLILIGEVFLYALLSSGTSFEVLVTVMTCYYAASKMLAFASLCVGSSRVTRIGRYIEKKKLNASIKEIKERIPQVKKEIENMKEKVDYVVESDTAKLDNSVDNAYYDLSRYIENDRNIKPTKVKVLSLTENKKR